MDRYDRTTKQEITNEYKELLRRGKICCMEKLFH